MIKSFIKFESHDELLPKLIGRVFHVTPTVTIGAIEASNSILPNTAFDRKSPYGNTENGFFRKRGSVSFFDYRNYGSKEWEEHSYKCIPAQILGKAGSISILFLCESQFERLESWVKWKEEEKWSQRVVPHIEVGYFGPVKLMYITEQLIVESENH